MKKTRTLNQARYQSLFRFPRTAAAPATLRAADAAKAPAAKETPVFGFTP